jgi:hypothetical protein
MQAVEPLRSPAEWRLPCRALRPTGLVPTSGQKTASENGSTGHHPCRRQLPDVDWFSTFPSSPHRSYRPARRVPDGAHRIWLQLLMGDTSCTPSVRQRNGAHAHSIAPSSRQAFRAFYVGPVLTRRCPRPSMMTGAQHLVPPCPGPSLDGGRLVNVTGSITMQESLKTTRGGVYSWTVSLSPPGEMPHVLELLPASTYQRARMAAHPRSSVAAILSPRVSTRPRARPASPSLTFNCSPSIARPAFDAHCGPTAGHSLDSPNPRGVAPDRHKPLRSSARHRSSCF